MLERRVTQETTTMAGSAISSGLVIGSAFVYRERQLEALASAEEIEEHQIKEEVQRIERATSTVAEDLRVSARRIETDTQREAGGDFRGARSDVAGPGLREEIRKLVEEELICAAHALSRVFRRRERKFREMTEPTHRLRADDVADLGRRLLRAMAGVKTTSLETMPPGPRACGTAVVALRHGGTATAFGGGDRPGVRRARVSCGVASRGTRDSHGRAKSRT